MTVPRALHRLLKKVCSKFAPPPKISVAQWAERYRFLSGDVTALPGRYSLTITPYLRGILECINDRSIRKVVCRKSAQIGWTDGVVNSLHVHATDAHSVKRLFMGNQDALVSALSAAYRNGIRKK